MKVVTGELMKSIDRLAIEKFSIPSIVLMENAALSVVGVIKDCIKDIVSPNIVIVAGKGNNGGDGFAIARHLYQMGLNVNVIFLGDTNSILGDALINYNITKNISVPTLIVKTKKEFNTAKKIIEKADIVVDALLGTGLKGCVKGIMKDFIVLVNENSKYTIAVDIPSGINSENGHIEGEAIRANITVTFAFLKQGLILYPANEYVGKLIITDIGIPKAVTEEIEINTNVLNDEEYNSLLPKRKPRSNKGTYGKLLVIAGSDEMTGAAILSSKAAYRMGVGLVNLASTKEVINIAQNNIIENINTILPCEDGKVCLKSFDTLKDIINNVSAIAVGPGLGQSKEVTKFICELLYNVKVPIIIDADALNAVAKDINILKVCKAPTIITPHPAEMSRLTGIPVQDILDNTVEIAKQFSLEYDVVTLLKDSRTIIANPDSQIYINTTGNSALAKGGSGDVLTGIISSLVAQGTNPFLAAALGAYIHGKAGEKASRQFGMAGVLASDLINYLH